MRIPNFISTISIFLMVTGLALTSLNAQSVGIPTDQAELSRIILAKDSAFWRAYNDCDLTSFATFLSDDLEFYHDKGGLTTSATALMKSIREGLCGDRDNYRLRREAVAGSVEVFPISDYGAVMTGKHHFFITQGDQAEYADGQARFTHLWRFAEEEWRITRVISYDHLPIQLPPTAPFEMAAAELARFAGRYRSQAFGPIVIKAMDGQLLLEGEHDLRVDMLPVGPNTFFAQDRKLTFEFTLDEEGSVRKLTVLENGNRVDEALPR
jgi:ketosteroid isomerase-like protein